MNKSQALVGHKKVTTSENGVDLFVNIARLLLNSWKTLAAFTFFGVLLSAIIAYISPKQYEAVAQIRLAQISQINPANPFGTPVEETASLISRMQFPTNYSDAVIGACAGASSYESSVPLAKRLKFTIVKGVPNTIELVYRSSSPESGFACLQSVFEQIVILQEQVSSPFVEEAKIKLASDNERIDAARKLILKADQSGSAMSAAYLSARDELAYFMTDREKMTDLINSVKNRGTKLASPIYVSNQPVAPKKLTYCFIGLIVGFLLGFLVVFLRRWRFPGVGLDRGAGNSKF
ncbi:hypothetical protein ICN10_06230 [Polynucleobacter sp. 86C-FISCH]|uniref:Wzz/FepE/Etk N-terminal domain-containing protein n=1 Tax=Polynucleobacter sp. 86C-FISCH TaxID=2689101 RepID=UPI001C0E5B0F|nr:Wzz/FepE/Etk N-terminal domain-containing protein [Polynucleobacter sp. 86C-FISCH]MBU3595997.1 hypothetical protein [Polynucleobacter sp. 86C-FISCH]